MLYKLCGVAVFQSNSAVFLLLFGLPVLVAFILMNRGKIKVIITFLRIQTMYEKNI